MYKWWLQNLAIGFIIAFVSSLLLSCTTMSEGSTTSKGNRNPPQSMQRESKQRVYGTAVGGSSSFFRAPMVKTSRLFAGPSQYPPKDFAAYGIFAFRSRPSPSDRDRHMMFCYAYVSTLPHVSELTSLPTSKQMVTVWPINSDSHATFLNSYRGKNLCDHVVYHYGLVDSLTAIKQVELTGVNISAKGPYLFAWSPATEKGKKDAPVLVADLSSVSTLAEAKQIFRNWVKDIELDPSVWENGFTKETFRDILRRWVDDLGPKLASILKSSR